MEQSIPGSVLALTDLYIPEVQYPVYKGPSLDVILNQPNLFYAFTPYLSSLSYYQRSI